MESWRLVWRKGIVPLLSRDHLVSLKEALEHNDPRLLQGVTTSPPPLMCTSDWPVEGACLLGYCAATSLGGFALEYGNSDYGMTAPSVKNKHAALVGDVEEQFARWCYEIDRELGESGGCRWFLNFWDETPRDELRKLMIPEVELAIEIKNESVLF